MHKKLAADLTSLAHSILQMKNKEDVFALKNKAHEVYEKLSVLAYVEEYINTTPNLDTNKEELIATIEKIEKVKEETSDNTLDEVPQKTNEEPENILVEENTTSEDVSTPEIIESVEVEKVNEPNENSPEEVAPNLFEAVEELEDNNEQHTDEPLENEVVTLEDELQDTLSVDVAADLFEATPKKSLNDSLQGDIQIGLNDRIAFVKNLFEGSQEDFNRVVSQLNTLKTYKEAKKFISKMVKPDYDWTDKEELEERFMAIVERKFV